MIDVKNPDVVNASLEAFPPVLNQPFPFAPPEPTDNIFPAEEGTPPAANGVTVEFLPAHLDVVPADEAIPPSNPKDFIVTDMGSLETSTAEADVEYTIVSVVDAATGGAPTESSENLLITLSGGPALTSFGIDLTNRQLLFPTVQNLPPPPPASVATSVPSRPIYSVGQLVVIVPNIDNSATPPAPFPWLTGAPYVPQAGGKVTVDTARFDAQAAYLVTGGSQDVTPETLPLPIDTETSEGGEIINVNVAEQQLTNGTPLEIHLNVPDIL